MAKSSLAEHNGALVQVDAVRTNNEAALRHLYITNFPKVEAFVMNNNGTSDQAKDIFQEAFIAVWRNIRLDRFQPQSETALDGYLYQIAKNKWMDHLRSGHYTKVVRMEGINMQDDSYSAEAAEENEYLSAVKKYFGELGDNCKKLLRMFYYDNDSLRQIGEKMGWTEATARNNKYRCIQKLRELITKKR